MNINITPLEESIVLWKELARTGSINKKATLENLGLGEKYNSCPLCQVAKDQSDILLECKKFCPVDINTGWSFNTEKASRPCSQDGSAYHVWQNSRTEEYRKNSAKMVLRLLEKNLVIEKEKGE